MRFALTFRQLIHASAAMLLVACPQPPSRPAAVSQDAGVSRRYDDLLRFDFNFRAQQLFLPLFWRADVNEDKSINPDELVVLWGPQRARHVHYLADGGFTPLFDDDYQRLTRVLPPPREDAAEARRLAAVKHELAQGQPVLLETEAAVDSAEDRAVLKRLFEVAELIERLYALQRGTTEMASRLPAGDMLSRALFHRNQGPWCVAPETEQDTSCSALPGAPPPRRFGLYPPHLQERPDLCAQVEQAPNGKQLAGNHFTMVRSEGGALVSVPYSEAWKTEMEAVAQKLDQAAELLTSAGEAPFRAYLAAAAQAFRTNEWEAADAAYVAMGSSTSKWYARIAPDDVSFEPCGWKAGFGFQLGRINPGSQEWQKKLGGLKDGMEQVLAGLAGPPSRARKVAFKWPDFVDVVLNAGDQRKPHGGVMGRSLPNWGRAAETSGRTVVMANLSNDADSQKNFRAQMASLFCAATMAKVTTDPSPALISTGLHEAAHRLGPSHDEAVRGKKDRQAFGGPLASMWEELQAQTASLVLVGWLAERAVVSPGIAEQARLRDLAWAMGQLSAGVVDAAGVPKPYAQTSAVQLGWLHRAGVLKWKAAEKAANQAEVGCFELQLGPPFESAVKSLARRVLGAKARGDRAAARRLQRDFVESEGEWKRLSEIIAARWLGAPKATFVYAAAE